jgi:hypothetical protein
VRLIGAGIGAAGAAILSLEMFDPAITAERAALVGIVGGAAVGISQPIATLLETLAAPEVASSPTSVTRTTTGLWLAAPFAFYAFLLVAR